MKLFENKRQNKLTNGYYDHCIKFKNIKVKLVYLQVNLFYGYTAAYILYKSFGKI